MKTNNNKKEIKYLNVCMDKALHEEFEAFCKAYGMSKVEQGWGDRAGYQTVYG